MSTTTAVVTKPKAAKTASHPPYFQMIKGALLALNEKSGSSSHAIAKHMEGKHKAVLPPNFRKTLALQLKNSAIKGRLIKIKSSFKLSEAGKKDEASKKKAVKAKEVKKPGVKAKTDKKKKNDKVVKTIEVAKPNAPAQKVEIVKKVTKPVAKKVTKPDAKKPTKKRSASMENPKQPKSIKSRDSKKAKRTPAKA